MPETYFRRTSPPHITTLVITASTNALSMNVFLPSLPNMAEYFDTDYAVMQFAVSLYLVATSVLQLFIGPASDRFGRRPVLLVCFVIFIAGTAASMFAPNVEVFLACRLMQAFSAAGMVLSRAIVRDTVEADDAASRIGYVTMGMALVPMIAPMIGGFLDEAYDWRASFLLTLVFGVLAIAVVYFDLGETNRRRSSDLAAQFRSYPVLLRSPPFWGYTLTAAFTSGTFFAFLGGGPYVSTEMLGLTPSAYGFYFGLISAGYIVGNFLTGRYSSRVGLNRMMFAGAVISTVGMAISLVLFEIGLMHPLSLFGPSAVIGVGNGLTLPSANAGIVSAKPDLAGSASGLGGALQMGTGALAAILASFILTPDSGPFPLIWVMLASSGASIAAALYVLSVGRRTSMT
jgi:DHA1 family bicyclomycin/chloramphenicol resistance-like MFS transporter